MTAQHKPEGDWFYTANDGDHTAADAGDLLDEEKPGTIIEAAGAREVWRGFGFKFTNADDEFECAWFATKAEAAAALAEIERKQDEADE